MSELVASLLPWQLNYGHLLGRSICLTLDREEKDMSAQVWLNANLVPLQKAVLCVNCEVISEGLNGHCAGCGSQSLLKLSGVLGGTTVPELSLCARSGNTVSDDVPVSPLSIAA